MLKQQKESDHKLFNFILSILPLLFIYQTFIPNLNLGYLVLMLTIIVFSMQILSKKIQWRFESERYLYILFMSILTITCFSVILQKIPVNFSKIALRFGMLLVWVVSIGVLSKKMFNYRYFKRYATIVALLATIYLIVQVVVWKTMQINLPGVLNNIILRPADLGYANLEGLRNYYLHFGYRPPSFFAEPAFYGYYIVLVLVMYMFCEKKTRRSIALILLFSVGGVMSTSTSAILIIAFIWVFFIIYQCLKFKKIQYFIGFALLSVIVVCLFPQIYETVIEKLSNYSDSIRGGLSFEYIAQLNTLQKFIGVGFGNEAYALGITSYYPSICTIILSTGFLGLAFFVGCMLFIFLKCKHIAGRLLLVIYLILLIPTSLLYSAEAILFFSFILFYRQIPIKESSNQNRSNYVSE